MNLTNYYYQFPAVLTPKFVDDIVEYGKSHTLLTDFSHSGFSNNHIGVEK